MYVDVLSLFQLFFCLTLGCLFPRAASLPKTFCTGNGASIPISGGYRFANQREITYYNNIWLCVCIMKRRQPFGGEALNFSACKIDSEPPPSAVAIKVRTRTRTNDTIIDKCDVIKQLTLITVHLLYVCMYGSMYVWIWEIGARPRTLPTCLPQARPGPARCWSSIQQSDQRPRRPRRDTRLRVCVVLILLRWRSSPAHLHKSPSGRAFSLDEIWNYWPFSCVKNRNNHIFRGPP